MRALENKREVKIGVGWVRIFFVKQKNVTQQIIIIVNAGLRYLRFA
ncbi:hypothetical protein [Bathymodiolus platifrons methanotrophic gill symbiont]|nr:hypothetical protein [Bathymodiolus platifrons methanotrophic gill symbiont]